LAIEPQASTHGDGRQAMTSTILLVDDDPRMLAMLRRTLAYEGYRVMTASDGATGFNEAQAEHPDLVILDWMLPDTEGVQIARQLRANDDTPILMLTARADVDDRVTGLDSGADDYLVKPFAPNELLARVRALLRRAPIVSGAGPLQYEDMYLDIRSRKVRRGTRSIALTPREFDLLHCFLRHREVVLTRDQLLTAVWGYDKGDETVLEVYIGYLRSKTETLGEPRLIQTVRGVGYVLRA
jgi:two-component system, OmpR family, response regulator MprA